MTDLASLVVRLEAEIGKYSENLDKAERQLKRFNDAAESQFKKLSNLVAGFFTVNRLIAWGDHILDNADRLQKFSQSTGIAVEDLSRLEHALDASGVPAEALTGLFKNLNDSISEAAGNAESEGARAFKLLGIDVRDASGELKNGQQVLLEMADKFAGFKDGANKSALAVALLGKTGAQAIPFLNQGADGIRRLTEEADKFGLTVSGETAKAAEEFNDRLSLLKRTIVDGIGNEVAKQLLPTLEAMSAEFQESSEGADALSGAVEPLIAGLKLLATVGLAVGAAFQVAGEHLAAMAAAQGALLQGEFRQAGRILIDEFDRQGDIIGKAIDRISILWREGGNDILREVRVTAQRLKQEAPNLAATKEIEKATEDAIKKLSELNRQLAEQVATFGLGEAEALRYRLTLGNLADEVKAAGASGDQLADSIIRQAEALQKLKDTKEITQALADVQSQIEALRGSSADAAIAAFDAKNAELVTKLRREGNTEGQKQLDLLLTLTVAQADFNEQTERAQGIQAELARTEERLRNSREAGAITELELQKELGEARAKAATDLEGVFQAQQKIADQVDNPKLREAVKGLGADIETLKSQVDVLANSIRAGFEDSFGDALASFINGTQSAGDAFREFTQDVARQLVRLGSQNIAQQVFGGLAGGAGGGGAGFFSTLAGLFAGGRATGGPVNEGMAYRVNERTPNSEWFVPDTSGSVVPAGKMGKSVVNRINVSIAAPSGTVTRQTQLDAAAAVARAVTLASRRNN